MYIVQCAVYTVLSVYSLMCNVHYTSTFYASTLYTAYVSVRMLYNQVNNNV